jgi:hypothetical protein
MHNYAAALPALYRPDRNGNFKVTAEDAKPFVSAGWVRVAERWRPPA